MKMFDLSSFLKRAPFVLPDQDPSFAVSEATSDARIKGCGWLKIDENGYLSHVSPEHICIHIPGKNKKIVKQTDIPLCEEIVSSYKREEAEQEWENRISRTVEDILTDRDSYNSGGRSYRNKVYYAKSKEEATYVFERFSSKGYCVSLKDASTCLLTDYRYFVEISW